MIIIKGEGENNTMIGMAEKKNRKTTPHIGEKMGVEVEVEAEVEEVEVGKVAEFE